MAEMGRIDQRWLLIERLAISTGGELKFVTRETQSRVWL